MCTDRLILNEVKFSRAFDSQGGNSSPDQLATEPPQLDLDFDKYRKKVLKINYEKTIVDSSYFLG